MDWIPVTERLPERKERTLIATHDNFIFIGVHGGGGFFDCGDFCVFATHWMPLPELPTVDATLPVEPALVPDVANDAPLLDRAEQSYNATGWTTERKDEQSILFSKPAPIPKTEDQLVRKFIDDGHLSYAPMDVTDASSLWKPPIVDAPMPKDAHEQLLTAINEHFTLDGMKIPRTF